MTETRARNRYVPVRRCETRERRLCAKSRVDVEEMRLAVLSDDGAGGVDDRGRVEDSIVREFRHGPPHDPHAALERHLPQPARALLEREHPQTHTHLSRRQRRSIRSEVDSPSAARPSETGSALARKAETAYSEFHTSGSTTSCAPVSHALFSITRPVRDTRSRETRIIRRATSTIVPSLPQIKRLVSVCAYDTHTHAHTGTERCRVTVGDVARLVADDAHLHHRHLRTGGKDACSGADDTLSQGPTAFPLRGARRPERPGEGVRKPRRAFGRLPRAWRLGSRRFGQRPMAASILRFVFVTRISFPVSDLATMDQSSVLPQNTCACV